MTDVNKLAQGGLEGAIIHVADRRLYIFIALLEEALPRDNNQGWEMGD